MEKERIIVSLTTWEKRFCNIPAVLDTIFNQTLPPELVVINLNDNEIIPQQIIDYLKPHNVIINHVPYKKVYKKLIPTLKQYPNDCIISIDDDWLYPANMIEDLWNTHLRYPNNPVSGNREFISGYTCHCGCASLTKASFFDDLDLIDQKVMDHCLSDDAVYTYFSVRSGHPYVWTNNTYFTNMRPYNQTESYTISNDTVDTIGLSWSYLNIHFGSLPPLIELLLQDKMLASLFQKKQELEISKAFTDGKSSVQSTLAYKFLSLILKPFRWLFPNK